ncbi:hypothetical protein L6452_39382 [Arctium lappa]|uniref:Uncharacterized protein n=1 Tax=Arctium lappa TaxID=4217 RepID=A0ACB8XT18_ARCLA|nr:hypothetical protein L6452_39382 [Arctium lappa]
MLKVSPWKGLIRFGKRGKLSPRFLGLFTILEHIGLQAYKLDLPPEMDGIHPTFHVCYLGSQGGRKEEEESPAVFGADHRVGLCSTATPVLRAAHPASGTAQELTRVRRFQIKERKSAKPSFFLILAFRTLGGCDFLSRIWTLVSHVEACLGIGLGYKSYVLSITILDEDLNIRIFRG